jgi:hypothetical protein
VIRDRDVEFHRQMQVPPPTWCPTCRMKRRMAFYNQRRLFRKKEANEGKEIFSTYSPKSEVKIYEKNFWNGDGWDARDYGRDYDPSRPFLTQFRELYQSVPLPSRFAINFVNSDYSDNAGDIKDCYMCFDGGQSENMSYSVSFAYSKDSIDCYMVDHSELCYQLIYSDGCYQCFFSTGLKQCRNVWFSRDCEGCEDCFGCANLRNKKYYIFNKEYSKEEYYKFVGALGLDSYANITRVAQDVREKLRALPAKYTHGTKNSEVVGDYVSNSSDSQYCYRGPDNENVHYTQFAGFNCKDCQDYTSWGLNVKLVYETCQTGTDVSNILFSTQCYGPSSHLTYCANVYASNNMFGCVGMRSKSYCILNKEYSKEEYGKLRAQIINDMSANPYKDLRGKEYKYGEFFPPEFSPWKYADSIAGDFFPLSAEQAVAEGYNTGTDVERPAYQVTLPAQNIADKIDDIDESVLSVNIGCATCGRAFRLIKSEFNFYKKYKLPIPRACQECRHLERVVSTNPIVWRESACARPGCSNTFTTSYPADTAALLYCESCYIKEVA